MIKLKQQIVSPTRRKKRRGTAVVEFAVIAPLMMLFTFGLVETGRLLMVKSQAVQATREGARLAVVPTADSASVIAKVDETLQILFIMRRSNWSRLRCQRLLPVHSLRFELESIQHRSPGSPDSLTPSFPISSSRP